MVATMKEVGWWGSMSEAKAQKCLDQILRQHNIDVKKAKSGKGDGGEKAWFEKVKV